MSIEIDDPESTDYTVDDIYALVKADDSWESDPAKREEIVMMMGYTLYI